MIRIRALIAFCELILKEPFDIISIYKMNKDFEFMRCYRYSTTFKEMVFDNNTIKESLVIIDFCLNNAKYRNENEIKKYANKILNTLKGLGWYENNKD